MVRFIVEISDEYVNNHADPDLIQKRLLEEGGRGGIGAMVNMIGFNKIKDSLDETGGADFLITEEEVSSDPRVLKLFEHTMGNLAALQTMLSIKKDIDKTEEK